MSTPQANRLAYADIEIGAEYSFERPLTRDDVMKFAGLTGDHNPLHVDPAFGARSIFQQNIAHGMLAGSLFSTLVGMQCPGENCLYFSQTLNFRAPIFFGQKLLIKGTVTKKHDSIGLITLKTEIIVEGDVKISGEAKVQVLGKEA